MLWGASCEGSSMSLGLVTNWQELQLCVLFLPGLFGAQTIKCPVYHGCSGSSLSKVYPRNWLTWFWTKELPIKPHPHWAQASPGARLREWHWSSRGSGSADLHVLPELWECPVPQFQEDPCSLNRHFHIHAHSLALFSSVAQSCLTLCDPVDCSMPGFPVHH